MFQAFTVTAKNDDDADSDPVVTLMLRATGADYGDAPPAEVEVAIEENDTQGLRLSATQLEVAEGGTASFTVRLNTEPSGGPVTVTVTRESGSDLTVTGPKPGDADLGAGGVLTFAASNWKVPQTVTVAAGPDDDAADDIETLRLKAEGADYGPTPAVDVAVTVDDRDTPALVLSTEELALQENSPAVSFTVKLASAPTAPVTVTVTGQAGTDLTVTGTALAFDANDWNAERTVTVAAGDDLDAAEDIVTLTLTPAGADEYAALDASTVAVTVADDDVPAIRLAPTSELEVPEDGMAVYEVSLTVPPTGAVTVRVTGMGTEVNAFDVDERNLALDGRYLTFTDENWNVAQRVTVRDAFADEDAVTETVTLRHLARQAGGEREYNRALPAELAVTVLDDDTAALRVSKTSLSVQEQGAGDAFTVRPAVRPSGPVTVTVSGQTGTALRVRPQSLGFGPSDWQRPKTFTVTAVADENTDDETVALALALSGAAEFAALDAVALEVTVRDDGEAGLKLSSRALEVPEGDSRRFMVRLNTRPSGDVRVSVARATGSDLAVTGPGNVDLGAGGVLTFTTGNWNSAQLVTVAAGEDPDAADDLETLRLTASGADYDGAPQEAVAVAVVDDETAALELSVGSFGFTVQEGGPARSFTVRLTAPPSAPVTVETYGYDAAKIAVTDSLVFDAETWNVPQPVTVEAHQDDDKSGGLSPLLLRVTGAPEYSGVTELVTVAIAEDDVASLDVSAAALTVPEGDDDGRSLTVRLNTAPSGDVRVRVEGVAGTDLTVTGPGNVDLGAGGVLTFTDTNWNVEQTVTVAAGPDDDAADDMATLTLDPSGADYGNAQSQTVEVTVRDADTPALEVADAPVTVREDGSGVAFRVRLATRPLAPVTVTVTGHDGTDVEVAPETATFTPSNWDDYRAFTVTAKDDADALADPAVTLALAATGSAEYETLAAAGVAVTIEENDTPGLDVSATQLDLAEGGNARFTVRLNTKPSGEVRVRVTWGSGSDLTVTGPDNADLGADGVLTFTETSWNSPQLVTVAAGADDDAVDDMATLTLDPSGADYGDAPDEEVAVAVDDDETAVLVLSKTALDAVENEPAVSFTVKLASAPTAPVTVTVTWGSGSDLTVTGPGNADLGAGGVLTFTAADWDVEQPVTVAAGDDADTADDIETLTLTPAGAAEYAAASEIRVSVADDDVPGTLSGGSFFDIANGTVTKAKRLAPKDNSGWRITVEPASDADVAIGVPPAPPAADCAEAAVVCTADGARLSAGPATTVPGPASLSVADATVQEGPNATLDFTVTLSRARHEATTVDYATSDGTATAGADYTAGSGTLRFNAGETGKTVSVAVLDDGHDEGSETMTFTLSNPVPAATAKLGDATATGTIRNTDPIPQAWIARFGRTVADQVTTAVADRFRAPRRPGVELTLAGERVGGRIAAEDEAARRDRDARGKLEALSDWLRHGAAERDGGPAGSRAVEPRELLTGSSFALTGEVDEGRRGTVALWGRGAVSSFDGREGALSLDGEVVSGMLGADWTRGPWTAGLLLSHARGTGSWRGDGAGKLSSSLTGAFPYGRHEVNERLSVWGVAGYGAGTLRVTPEDGTPIDTGLDLAMAASGLRGTVLRAGPDGGPELAAVADGMAVRTTSAAARAGDGGRLAAARATVTRLRLGLEGSWRGLTVGTGTLAPRLEVGVRHDGGDAETGFGLDLGGGLALTDPGSGVQAEVRGRGLLTHESAGFRERGFSGALSWDPTPGSDRGARLSLAQTVGASATGGMNALLGRGTMAGLAANDNGGEDDLRRRRLELKLGYGFSVLGDRFTSIPEIGVGLSDSGRDYRLGWRLKRDMRGDTGSLEFSLEATRRESANDNAEPEHGIGFRLTARW